MNTKGFKRKLAAILSADVAGYSRLMGEDEEATIRTLTDYREVISALIDRNQGRVVDSPGDNLLAEFSSVVDAVQCALEIQQELVKRNTQIPEGRKDEAQAEIPKVLKQNPDYSQDVIRETFPLKDRGRLARILESLREAGLP